MGKALIRLTDQALLRLLSFSAPRMAIGPPADSKIVKVVRTEEGMTYIAVESEVLPDNPPGESYPLLFEVAE